jgi:hypothetical protein
MEGKVDELTPNEVEFHIQRAQAEQTAEGMHPQAYEVLRARTIAEGRCGARTRQTGLPCRIQPFFGDVRCRKHGSKLPESLAKSERALAIARMPAIEAVLDLLEQYNAHRCDACGFPLHDVENRRTMLTAAKMVLDRTGLGPKATLQVNGPQADDTDALIEVMTPEQREEVAGLVTRLDAIKAEVRARIARVHAQAAAALPGEVIDVEPSGGR